MASLGRHHTAGRLIGVAPAVDHRFHGVGLVQTVGQWGEGLWVATLTGVGDPIQGGQGAHAAHTVPILVGQLVVQNVRLPLGG